MSAHTSVPFVPPAQFPGEDRATPAYQEVPSQGTYVYAQQPPPEVAAVKKEEETNVAQIFFFVGFCCPFLWWIGCGQAALKKTVRTTFDYLNVIFGSILLSLGVIVMLMLQFKQHSSGCVVYMLMEEFDSDLFFKTLHYLLFVVYRRSPALLSANAAAHQIALNLITAWAKNLNMSFGTMIIPPNHKQPVPIPATYKYLGIYINKTLDRVQMYKCKDQIQGSKGKTYLKINCPLCYRMLRTPKFLPEYGVTVIGGFFDCRILQHMINKAIRQIFNLPMLTPIAPMLVASTVFSFSAIGRASRLKLYKKYRLLAGNLLSRLLNTPLSCRNADISL
ncbi:hypothetical protein BC833DRAFT_622579 [Globomyces pollinis-pini]|nr:hypothetical protein BC833DRAFT_622579 [Globomyces pollinis-pini]